jgi:hypothetical protein
VTRVLLCCDYGAPAELLRDSLTLGKALADRQCHVSYAVGDPVSLADFAGSWVPGELHQAPVLRSAPQLVMKRPPIDGFADVIAAAGFDDKATLFTMVDIWMRMISSIKPDVIYGFYSPIVWMLGPSAARTVALGNGYGLPPALGNSFPRLTSDSSPIAADNVMLANANAALTRLGQPQIAALSEILTRCTMLLYGSPSFDPYLQLRRTLTVGLLGGSPSPVVMGPAPRLAAFLDVSCPGVESMVLALAGTATTPVDVFINGPTAGMRRFLEQHAHVKLWNEHAALLEQAASASAIVHHGEQDVAQRALSLGRPQLIVPWTREQQMTAEMMKWMGLLWTKTPNVSVEEFAGTFRAILRDGSLVVAAQHHARQLANSGMPDALPALLKPLDEARG